MHFRLSLRFVTTAGFLLLSAVAAPPGHKCTYVAGTVSGFNENTHGRLDVDSPRYLLFTSNEDLQFQIPWDRIQSIAYGQKSGRRMLLTLMISPWLRMTSRREHFVTIRYLDSGGRGEGILLEDNKNSVAADLLVMSARSGKKVEYESTDAKSHVHG